ncbi:MAG TPA: hypothetical protein PK264_21470, partial [Hyphomicrobiaceae bacterium]|nr:hypothetical protein [Hyphomicrobiaceae bacterium]
CRRWESKVIAPPVRPTLPATAPTPEELKLLRAMDETVRGRGSLIEFGGNGRYTVMADRFAADVRIYTGQSYHPALCSGAGDMLKFYAETLAPLKSRIKVVADMDRRAQTRARAAVGSALADLARPSTGDLAASETPKSDAPSATVATASDVPPPQPSVPETIEAMTAALADIALPEGAAQAIKANESVLQRLKAFAEWLMSEPGLALTGVRRETVLVALRALEIAAHVEAMQARYVVLETALLGNLLVLKESQRRTCTCGT